MTTTIAAGSAHAARMIAVKRSLECLSGFYRAWKNRRAFYRLGEWSDAQLADIGLTRADLHVAMSAPFSIDPTEQLRTIAAGRLESINSSVGRTA
jgi:uncharacterized protein YjiS (DUF1127 family)